MATNRLEEFFLRPHRNSHIEFSRLVPYSSLILTISCVAIFLYRIYMLEPLVKRFTEQYNHLRQDQQRSLINHYVAASIKLLLIFLAVYPSIMIISGRKDLHSPFAGPKVRYGDILLFVFEIFTAMYIFELFYREKISYISGAHHIGAIIITQTSIVLFQDTNHLRDAELEFLLCLVWGFFDICAELWPHIAMIIYRTWPKTHGTLADIFLATTILEIVGTTFETTIVFMIFFSVWKDWTITFKVLTPVLHILFSCAQLWGARVFWMMSRQHREAANNDIVEDWVPEASSARLDGHIEVLGKHQSTPGCCAAKEIV